MALRTFQNDEEIAQEIKFLKGIGTPLSGKFRVAGKFDLALGKFPIGTVGGYAYFDINSAFQNIINCTLAANGKTNSKLVQALSDKNRFRTSDYAS